MRQPEEVSERACRLLLLERTRSRFCTGGLAGAGRLTRSLAAAGLAMAPPIDFRIKDRANVREHDLLRDSVFSDLRSKILSGALSQLQRFGNCIRTVDSPGGSGNSVSELESNLVAARVVHLAGLLEKGGRQILFENPGTSQAPANTGASQDRTLGDLRSMRVGAFDPPTRAADPTA